MTKGQKNLIGLLFSVLLFAIIVFRSDLLIIKNRPGISVFLTGTFSKWGISLAFLLFGYFLSKLFKVRWWIFIAVLAFFELFYLCIFNFGPSFLPESIKIKPFFSHFKRVNLANRPLIQFEKECAQYDSVLFYTLKPGVSHFKSYEFDNLYNVNSKGYRDTEEDLKAPKILFLGDSFTMGWGVDQDKNFASIFESKSGLKTLNTGISSYGTARELYNFNKIDSDSLKLIVIQFHDTDLLENNHFKNTGKLGTKTKQDFDYQVNENEKIKKYYPFKHLKTAIIDFITFEAPIGELNKINSPLTGEYQKYPSYLSDFYSIIEKIRVKYSGPIIYTYVGSFYTDSKVIDSFKKYSTEKNIKDIYFVTMTNELTTKEYFFFDDHINPLGHQKVAEKLLLQWNQIK